MSSQKSVKLRFCTAFQVKYCLIIVIVFACANFSLYLLIDKAMSGSYLQSLRTLYALDQNLPFYLCFMAFLQIFFILVLTLIITLLVSHQIAGPIFSYERVLNQISAGQFPDHVSTRSSDQLKTIVDSLNEFTSSSRNVYGHAQSLSDAIESGSATDIESLKQQISTVRKSMGAFYSGGGNQ